MRPATPIAWRRRHVRSPSLSDALEGIRASQFAAPGGRYATIRDLADLGLARSPAKHPAIPAASGACASCPKCAGTKFTQVAWLDEDFVRSTCACGATGRVRGSILEEVPLPASARRSVPPLAPLLMAINAVSAAVYDPGESCAAQGTGGRLRPGESATSQTQGGECPASALRSVPPRQSSSASDASPPARSSPAVAVRLAAACWRASSRAARSAGRAFLRWVAL